MTFYLEQYLDSLEALPNEMRRHFTMMQDLDRQSQSSLSSIDGMVAEYVASARDMNPQQRHSMLGKIESVFLNSKNLSDEKVNLAQETYNLVDKHIRRLDNDLARFEGELKQSIAEDKKKKRKANKKMEKILAPPKKRKAAPVDEDDEIPKFAKKKGKISANNPFIQQSGSNTSLISLSSPSTSGPSLYDKLASVTSDVLDMPVDPNEPTYCTCQQVSYGEMIGCDNPDCPIEWFHFGCIGLTSQPKGKWYCSECQEFKKSKKM